MKTQLYVGQASMRGSMGKYTKRFNMLELRAELGRLPGSTVLRRWSEEAPPHFVFSVMLGRQIGQFMPNQESELKLGLQAAEAIAAKWFVVKTEPSIGPSQRSRQRLGELFSRLADTGRSIAWEPHGVWQDDEAASWTHELGVHLVRDISRGDPLNENVIYSRMPGIGTASRMSAGALEHAAASLVHASEAYIIVGGDSAGRALQLLRSLVRGSKIESGDQEHAYESVPVFGESAISDELDEYEEELEDSAADGDLDDEDESSVNDEKIELSSVVESDWSVDKQKERQTSQRRGGDKRR